MSRLITAILRNCGRKPAVHFLFLHNPISLLFLNSYRSSSLYQTEMGERMERERRRERAEAFFRKYQFVTLSTCRSWAGRDARLLVVAARERELAE